MTDENQKPEATNPDAQSGLSSASLLGRIRELEKECGKIKETLRSRGQMVAAAQMSDAEAGLHKTLSVWNNYIKW